MTNKLVTLFDWALPSLVNAKGSDRLSLNHSSIQNTTKTLVKGQLPRESQPMASGWNRTTGSYWTQRLILHQDHHHHTRNKAPLTTTTTTTQSTRLTAAKVQGSAASLLGIFPPPYQTSADAF